MRTSTFSMRSLVAIQFARIVLPQPKLIDKPFPVPRGMTEEAGQGSSCSFLQREKTEIMVI